jgi:hypothetical protein
MIKGEKLNIEENIKTISRLILMKARNPLLVEQRDRYAGCKHPHFKLK